MMRIRPPSLVVLPILLVTLTGQTGCGADDATGSDTGASAVGSDVSSGSGPGARVDDALDAVGEDRVLEITAEQLVGSFGLIDYEVSEGRLTMLSEQASDQAELQCLQAQLVLDGVGVASTLFIKYDDTTVNCEDFS